MKAESERVVSMKNVLLPLIRGSTSTVNWWMNEWILE
jgi:hypothetical protein